MNARFEWTKILHTRRYTYLLGALLAFVALHAVLGEIEAARGRFLDWAFLGVLVVALYAAGEGRMGTGRVVALAGLVAAVVTALRIGDRSSTRSAAVAVLLGFFVLVTVALLSDVLTNRRLAVGERIRGAICVYFLLGVSWAVAYVLISALAPGSFSGLGLDPRQNGPDLLYYSFITLATVGYGDIVPASDLARTLAWLEAFTGQMYVAITIARLVSLREGGGDGAP